MKKSISILLSLIMLISSISVLNTTAYAAVKKPAPTSITSITSNVKGFKIKWKKQEENTKGYKIQYSTSSKFKNATTITISKNTTTSKKISNLKSKKKYYVRIRTYRTVKGKNYYSEWSKVKSVTTKAASSSSSSSSTSVSDNTTVYITPTGTKYHLVSSCGGKNSRATKYSEVKGSYQPCKKCAS